MGNFKELWKAIVDHKESDEPKTPTISKALPIMKWIESFTNHLKRYIGVRCVPLLYVIRPNVTVPSVCPPLQMDQPYSEMYGSFKGNMIACATLETRSDHI